MSDEHDSWFQDAFGVDLAAAAQRIRDEAFAMATQAAGAVEQVVEGAKTTVESGIDGAIGGITGVVKKVAGAVTSDAGSGAAASGGPDAGTATGSFPLRGSVGRGGRNAAGDVSAVQAALGIEADGRCGPATIAAIEAFQRQQGMAKADGRVDPGGATERALSGGGAAAGGADGDAGSGPTPPAEDDSLLDQARGAVASLAEGAGSLLDGGAGTLGGVDLREQTEADGAGDGAERAQGIADNIVRKLKSGGDLRFDIAMLRGLPMPELLDVMDRVQAAGKLAELDGSVPNGETRVKVAMRTVLRVFDSLWQKLVQGLGDADRQAILSRTPKNVRIASGFEPSAPKEGDGEEDGPEVEVDVAGVTTQGKIEFRSAELGPIGQAEVSIKLGANGLLEGVELDILPIKKKIENFRKLGPLLDLEAKLTLNAEAEIDSDGKKVAFEGVELKLKGEVELHFKTIPVLKLVKIKLSASGGSGGFSAEFSIVFAIPGS